MRVRRYKIREETDAPSKPMTNILVSVFESTLLSLSKRISVVMTTQNGNRNKQ